MNPLPIESARDADLRMSRAAMIRARESAHELARRTGTQVIVSRLGRVEHLEPVIEVKVVAPVPPPVN